MKISRLLKYTIPALIIGFLAFGIAYADNPNFWLLSSNFIKPLSSGWNLMVGSHASNPTEGDGGIYYNTVTKTFQCGINGSWQNCATATGTATGILSLNGLTGSTQTFATNTTATGLNFNITSTSTTHTFALSLQGGYVIPLTASTTNWNNLYNVLNGLTLPVSVANGGTGTTTPGLIQGTNISITGSFPFQTINTTGVPTFNYASSTFVNYGYASSTFQTQGNYITALTGDVTASGPGSVAATLKNTGSAGSCTNCNITFDAQGRETAQSNGSAGSGVSFPISYASSTATTTNTIWTDVNRTDSYTANGSIVYPYKSISSMLGASAWGSGNAYNLAPGTYVDGAPDTFPTTPFYLSGNEATYVPASGVTLPGSFDIYDLTIAGNVTESDNSLTYIHQFNNGVISGNLSLAGNATLQGMAMPSTTSVLSILSGALTNANGSFIQSQTQDYGTFNLNDDEVIASTTSTGAAIIASTTGSTLNILGATIIQQGKGGAINVSNGATSTPNNIMGATVVSATTTAAGGIHIGNSFTFLCDVNVYSSINGQTLYPDGTNYEPCIDGALTVQSTTTLQGVSTLATTTIAGTLAVNGTGNITAGGQITANNYNSTGSSIPANGWTESAANVITFYTGSSAGLSINSVQNVNVPVTLSVTGTSTLATTTITQLSLGDGLINSILAVNSTGQVIATTTSAGGVTAVNGSGSILSSGGSSPTIQLQTLTNTDVLFGLGTNVIGTSSTFTYSTTTNNLFVTNASTTNLTVSNVFYTPGMANGCVQVSSGIATSTGSNCGAGGGGAGGVGTTSPFSAGYIPEATGTNVSLSNSNIFQSTAGLVAVGTSSPSALLQSALDASSTAGTYTLASTTAALLLGETNASTTRPSGGMYFAINSPSTFTGNFLNFQNNGAETDQITYNGDFKINSVANSATALQIQNSSGSTVLQVDETAATSGITIGTTTTSGIYNAGALVIVGSTASTSMSDIFVASSTGAEVFAVWSSGHYGAVGSLPTIATSTGDGSPGGTATISAGSTDQAGLVSILTSNAPVASSMIWTLTFAVPYSNAPFCTISSATSTPTFIEDIWATTTTSTLVLKSSTTALIGTSTYASYYSCFPQSGG